MVGAVPRLVLASASPRRLELLALIGVRCQTAAADIDETPVADESAAAMVERLAVAKAAHIHSQPGMGDSLVLAADTTVLVDGQILGKPSDDAEATEMLSMLGGAEHYVLTGIALSAPDGQVLSAVDITTVWMRGLSDADIAWYLSTGEHRGKAGAYGIQGAASVFVGRIDGDYQSVVGLPLAALDRLLMQLGYNLSNFS